MDIVYPLVAVALLLSVLLAMRYGYYCGVLEGYGYAKWPENETYRRAGEIVEDFKADCEQY